MPFGSTLTNSTFLLDSFCYNETISYWTNLCIMRDIFKQFYLAYPVLHSKSLQNTETNFVQNKIKMEYELKSLKSVLRSLVVSSSIQVDVYSLQKDYRSMMGTTIPVVKYGYKDTLSFLKERCSDCFLFNGSPSNPVLTLIVPDNLKHIDNFVQKQKVASSIKYRGKRRSVSATKLNPPPPNLIATTFNRNVKSPTKHHPTSSTKPAPQPPDTSHTAQKTNGRDKENDYTVNGVHTVADTGGLSNDSNVTESSSHCKALHNFLRKRSPLFNSTQSIANELDCDAREGSSRDDDSEQLTLSSTSSSKLTKLEELKTEIRDLVAEHPGGVWCTDLIRLYRERYKCEMNYARFGYTSIVSLVSACAGLRSAWAPDAEDWLLRRHAAPAPAPAPTAPPLAPHPAPPPRRPAAARVDPDDALPGIDFEPDVFPADCMHFMESVPALSLAELRPGGMLEVIVGEVYSPSHLWLIRLGDRFDIAMEDLMDQMTAYYSGAEGGGRALARGAVRVGHYCCSVYEGDWHRSLIVQLLDSDTVKVRHVDYGTVDVVPVAALKPLRRCWAELPAQALRARLAGVRPSAAGRRWPHAAAHHFLHLVRDRRLVAHLAAIDREEEIMEVFLIDTSREEDVCISSELIRSGHADARPDSAVKTSEWHLFPRFEALESGAAPNYAEVRRYLRDGIALDYVDAYRRHVPACLPPRLPPPPATRVPLRLADVPRSPPPAQTPSPATAPFATWPAETFPPPPPTAAAAAVPLPPPPVPPGARAGGEVRLPVRECALYQLLARADPLAAHCYMVGAISRAMAALSTLNPAAPSPLPARLLYPPPPPHPPSAPAPSGLATTRAPPGFG